MASTIFIDNQTTIYAEWLNNVNSVVYDGIFQSPTITATSIVCTGTASGAGFTNLVNNTFASPAAIGNVTPNTGAFSTLTATTLNATSITTTSITATSLTGLTTPLSRAQGGTGLSAVGTAGNVLTSDGTNWVSSASQSIGLQQTWQDVTASRAYGTTYTNSTGRPIFIVVGTSASSLNGSLGITIDGVMVNGGNSAPNGGGVTVSCLIPPGSTYSVSVTGGSVAALANWQELR
jgi:hypothetical protein